MLDINLIRTNPAVVRKSLELRNMDTAVVDEIIKVDEERRAVIGEVEALKAERNTVSKEIGKQKDPEKRQAKIAAMKTVSDRIKELDSQVRTVDEKLYGMLAEIPNIVDDDVPVGKNDEENVVLKVVGEKKHFLLNPSRIGN